MTTGHGAGKARRLALSRRLPLRLGFARAAVTGYSEGGCSLTPWLDSWRSRRCFPPREGCTRSPPPKPRTPGPSSAGGQAAYTQGDYETAIGLWQRAYALDARPALQYNLAQAYGRLGQLERESEALERFIDTAPPESATLPAARARQAALRERLARTGVEVAGAPDGALVLIDGVERGRTPLPEPIRVPGGEHTITLRAPGYADFQTGLSVNPGDVERVTVVMVPSATPGPTDGEDRRVSPAAWALFGVGGAALVTGTTLGVLALGESDGALRGSSEADRARGLALGADVSFVVGGAAVAAGLIALIVSRRHTDDPGADAALRLAPVASRSTAGLVLEGSF